MFLITAVLCGLMLMTPAAGFGAGKTIVIGGSLPLTGAYAETGQWIEKGMRFWADEINTKGGLLGRPVEFKIYDDQSDVGKAVTFAEKVIPSIRPISFSAAIRVLPPGPSCLSRKNTSTFMSPWAAI